MKKRQDILNPFPGEVPDRLAQLLFAWARWRERKGSPGSARFPEVTFRHVFAGGSLVQIPGFCLTRATDPRRVTWHEDFTQAFCGLAEDQRAYVLALVELANEPWLRGKRWTDFLTLLELKPKAYERLLKDALRTLNSLARKRGLL